MRAKKFWPGPEYAGFRHENIAVRPPKDVIRPQNDLYGVPLGSTWQSLVRGQGTVETEFLNGEIVRLAAKLGTKGSD